MIRYALVVSYDGSGFEGWQTQPSGRAVQDVLEASLAAFAGEPIRVRCAGRTDAGVHALAQVVDFETRASRPLHGWVRGVNARLDARVAVLRACEVPAGFHARFSARARHYVYLLQAGPVREPLLVGRAGWFHAPLDAQAMHEAAQALLGTHDFTAFRAAGCQARTPVRTLSAARVEERNGLVLLHFSADGFLHHMVRNIVGSLVYVGAGRQPRDWLGALLRGRDRRLAAPTFAPDGLYFCGVDYDPALGVDARASLRWPL